MPALSTTFKDPSNVIEIDDCTEVYGGRAEFDCDEIDDMGEGFEDCEGSAGGHIYLTQCGVTACVHCGKVVGR